MRRWSWIGVETLILILLLAIIILGEYGDLTKSYARCQVETTLLSSKGQVIIPKTIRSHHHWSPGTRFAIEDVQGGVLLKPISSFATTDLQSGLGCVGYKGVAKSLDEMQAAIDAEVARTWRDERQ